MKAPAWEERPDGSHFAKIGRYQVIIFPPADWKFWRGDHKGVPCHTGPGTHRTIGFHANANDGMSSGAFTLEGAKVNAVWRVKNGLTGHLVPDSLLPQEELDARALWDQTVEFVNQTYGEK